MDLLNIKDKEGLLAKLNKEAQARMRITLETALENLDFQKQRLSGAKKRIKKIRDWNNFLERYSPGEVMKINLWERSIPTIEAGIDDKIGELQSGGIPALEECLVWIDGLSKKINEFYSVLFKK